MLDTHYVGYPLIPFKEQLPPYLIVYTTVALSKMCGFAGTVLDNAYHGIWDAKTVILFCLLPIVFTPVVLGLLIMWS